MFDKRYRRYIQSFLLVMPMTGIVTGINTLVARGLRALFTLLTLERWMISILVAFPCVLFMQPFAVEVTNHLIRRDR